MQKIKIITDSCLDIPKHLIEENDIEVLPVLINFEEESYLDTIEITISEMQKKIEEKKVLPTTAQIIPRRFEECFKKYLDQGYKIVALIMSANMSGTYESACLAKNMLESDDIVVIDSNTITSGLGLLTLEACRLRDAGRSIVEIEKELNETKNKIKSSIAFESLDNLVKGGRISKTAGAIGTALGLRLILEIKDGTMAVKDKIRGNKKVIKKIISDYEDGNPDASSPVALLVYDNDDLYNALKEYLEGNDIEYITTTVGCAVGIHSGPKVCGLLFISKEATNNNAKVE
ncbi:DegV family protein [Clostridium gasigenes]|uniref:DegV family protein n=1 Tax=Clostridium gasigenes TaxID=94869 RepID=UPI001C0E8C15|nr:DegV family protein [Clostridium gasigenes]MBU3108752.1 DegV family protein [Clostridium gasigenes]